MFPPLYPTTQNVSGIAWGAFTNALIPGMEGATGRPGLPNDVLIWDSVSYHPFFLVRELLADGVPPSQEAVS